MKRGEMPKLNGLFEAALSVQNFATACDFYQQVVGLEKLRESEVGCVFIVAEKQLLLLIEQEKARVSSKTPGGEVPPCLVRPGASLGAGHIAFAVADFSTTAGGSCISTSPSIRRRPGRRSRSSMPFPM
jgi:catechol 2,3-dioxygenase-like lactoylglutathione lyase family enzyme